MSVSELISRREIRPAYARFERTAIEDKVASRAAGRCIMKHEDIVYLTQIGSRDATPVKVAGWWDRLDQQIATGQIPAEFKERYRRAYDAWCKNQEEPADGTPIKGWGVITPAQQETLLRSNIRTVEDLAVLNAEGMQRIGMGANDLRRKAAAWLAQLQDKGPLTLEVSALKAENERLKTDHGILAAKVEQLTALLEQRVTVAQPAPAAGVISADDLFDSEDQPLKRSPGRPRKQESAA
ncbi:MAG: hypothetical protein FJX68_12670 [Alphaproteobacteria bacterium]|nr:hypothetical protein [Alphaproteobacteria bacterium]